MLLFFDRETAYPWRRGAEFQVDVGGVGVCTLTSAEGGGGGGSEPLRAVAAYIQDGPAPPPSGSGGGWLFVCHPPNMQGHQAKKNNISASCPKAL